MRIDDNIELRTLILTVKNNIFSYNFQLQKLNTDIECIKAQMEEIKKSKSMLEGILEDLNNILESAKKDNEEDDKNEPAK